jgi:hypothetical protein
VTATDIAQILAAVALGLAALSLLLGILLFRTSRRLQRDQRVILGPRGEEDIVQHVTGLDEKMNNLRAALEDLTLAARDHEVCIDGCLSRVGIVRFDAYHDLGGRQSSSVALLDAKETGLVITTVVSREFAIYVKNIRSGQADIPLAPEEIEAVDQARARGNAPFTVRPRIGSDPGDGGEEAFAAQQAEEQREAAARAQERENRRRKRQGLPPLSESSLAPSTLGWPKIEPVDALDGQESEPAPNRSVRESRES